MRLKTSSYASHSWFECKCKILMLLHRANAEAVEFLNVVKGFVDAL